MEVVKIEIENFSLEEIACPCGRCIPVIDKEHLIRMQLLRYMWGKPLKVNSWYRCLEYNRTIEGSSDLSQHVLGRATDICTIGWSGQVRFKFLNLTTKIGFKGIGPYRTFTHLDSRDSNSTFWIN